MFKTQVVKSVYKKEDKNLLKLHVDMKFVILALDN